MFFEHLVAAARRGSLRRCAATTGSHARQHMRAGACIGSCDWPDCISGPTMTCPRPRPASSRQPCTPRYSRPVRRSLPHLHRDRVCCHIWTGTGSAATSGPRWSRAPARPLPHLFRDSAHPCHICTGTGLTPPTSAPGLGRTPPTCAVDLLLLAARSRYAIAAETTHARSYSS